MYNMLYQCIICYTKYIICYPSGLRPDRRGRRSVSFPLTRRVIFALSTPCRSPPLWYFLWIHSVIFYSACRFHFEKAPLNMTELPRFLQSLCQDGCVFFYSACRFAFEPDPLNRTKLSRFCCSVFVEMDAFFSTLPADSPSNLTL